MLNRKYDEGNDDNIHIYDALRHKYVYYHHFSRLYFRHDNNILFSLLIYFLQWYAFIDEVNNISLIKKLIY